MNTPKPQPKPQPHDGPASPEPESILAAWGEKLAQLRHEPAEGHMEYAEKLVDELETALNRL